MKPLGLMLASTLNLAVLRDIARSCEDNGAHALWFPDTRFVRDPFVGLAQLAAATDHVTIGTAVTDPYVRHPALLAMAIGTIGELAPGRLRLGLGAGASGLAHLGIERSRPVTTLRDAVATIRALLAGKAVDLTEGAGPPVQLEFPTRPVPVLIGTRSPGLLRLAGEVADGAILGHLVDATAIARARQEMEAAAGDRHVHLIARIQVIVGGTVDDRRRHARQVAAWVVRQHAGRLDWLEEIGLSVPDDLRIAIEQVTSPRDVGRAFEFVPDELANALALQAADRTHAAELIAGISDIPGVDELMLRVDTLDGEEASGAVAVLASAIDAN